MNIPSIEKKLYDQGYTKRQNQLDMIEAIGQSITQKEIILIEGGTGIGKTFAYLIPAIMLANKIKRIVVTTATTALQEQLFEKDLPDIQRLLGTHLKVALAKGRGRYVCLAKLSRSLTGDQASLAIFGVDNADSVRQDAAAAQAKTLISLIDEEAWDGDFDHLGTPISDRERATFNADASTCTNRRCAFFKDCAYFKAKKTLGDAQLIIANHDLLLSDMALGSGKLLPKSTETYYLIDEAHHLPEKAIKHFSAQVSILGVREWLEGCFKTFSKVRQTDLCAEHHLTAGFDAIDQLQRQLPLLFAAVESFYRENLTEQSSNWCLVTTVPEALSIAIEPLITEAKTLETALMAIQGAVKEASAKTLTSQVETFLMSLSFYTQRAYNLSRTWTLFLAKTPDEQSPHARWFEERTLPKKPTDFVCHVAQTGGQDILSHYLFDRIENGATLCSATLRALGSFDNFVSQAGLSNHPHKTYAFPSPFDYPQSTLRLADIGVIPEGKSAQAFADQVANIMPDLLHTPDCLGTLVLFTSKVLLESTYEQLPSDTQKLIQKQGDLQKMAIIRTHKSRIDQGKKSIIFGLASFAEGVDLPGKYCEHVVITKIPFANPSDPIELTRQRWLAAQGKNAFMIDMLPKASIKLTQCVGRLIRTQSDRGTVTILDGRLTQKRYGSALLANLPPFAVDAKFQLKAPSAEDVR